MFRTSTVCQHRIVIIQELCEYIYVCIPLSSSHRRSFSELLKVVSVFFCRLWGILIKAKISFAFSMCSKKAYQCVDSTSSHFLNTLPPLDQLLLLLTTLSGTQFFVVFYTFVLLTNKKWEIDTTFTGNNWAMECKCGFVLSLVQ